MIKKDLSKLLVNKSKFVWKKPPRAQIFSYFSFKSRNNNQLLSKANAKDNKLDYYITSSTLVSRYHGSLA